MENLGWRLRARHLTGLPSFFAGLWILVESRLVRPGFLSPLRVGVVGLVGTGPFELSRLQTRLSLHPSSIAAPARMVPPGHIKTAKLMPISCHEITINKDTHDAHDEQ